MDSNTENHVDIKNLQVFLAYRAWWVIESVFFCSPDKRFWAYLGDIPPDMPRQPETWISLCNLMLKLRDICKASLSSGQIVPRVTIARVTPFITRDRPNVKHSIAGYSMLPQPCCIGSTVVWRNQGTPLAIPPKIMARYEEAEASF